MDLARARLEGTERLACSKNDALRKSTANIIFRSVLLEELEQETGLA